MNWSIFLFDAVSYFFRIYAIFAYITWYCALNLAFKDEI